VCEQGGWPPLHAHIHAACAGVSPQLYKLFREGFDAVAPLGVVLMRVGHGIGSSTPATSNVNRCGAPTTGHSAGVDAGRAAPVPPPQLRGRGVDGPRRLLPGVHQAGALRPALLPLRAACECGGGGMVGVWVSIELECYAQHPRCAQPVSAWCGRGRLVLWWGHGGCVGVH